jgi:putative component of membrane protein insertase Oxa1/YidC/SpoIIIJ protein YidD
VRVDARENCVAPPRVMDISKLAVALGALPRWALRAIATPIVLGVYLFVRLLMRVAPDAGYMRKLKAERVLRTGGSAAVDRGRANLLVRLTVALYRHSWMHNYMHRNGSRCCFVPSCSEYSLLAVQRHGLWRGLLLIGDRFRRCTPAYDGDYVDFP